MARVSKQDVQNYAKEREERMGGSKDAPKLIKSAEPCTATCLGLAFIRSKKGRWGVSALMLAVDGPDVGGVTKHDMWNARSVHQFIVDGFGYMSEYDNGLPESDPFDDDFSADPDMLDDMMRIAEVGDQKNKGGKWLPGIPERERRSPYVRLVLEEEEYEKRGGGTGHSVRVKWVNGTTERGTDGPYYVSNFRDVRVRFDAEQALKWFDAKCEKQVRDANEARSGSGGGRSDEPGSGGAPYQDDEIPF